MNLLEANNLAYELMSNHDLIAKGWSFQFDNAKNRFGRCSYNKKLISLSRHLTKMNDEDQVKDTILHEIAHALVGPGVGHGLGWKRKCVEVGANPNRTYDHSVNRPKHRYLGYCPNCDRLIGKRHRLKKETLTLACTPCCRKYNGGKHDERFILRWEDTTIKDVAHNGGNQDDTTNQ